jgi:hexosaminidase
MIDALASLKINRMQMHLTDDQGWRIEIRKYPRLAGHASTRKGTWRPGMGDWQEGRHDGIPHGGFYTQDDLREIVAYAARRHLVVVPEIEMPGHARAWISAYPDMAVDPGKARGLELWVHWGVSKDVLGMRPATLAMAKDVLDEVCGIFPSPWIHIGGDEAPRDQWLASSEMRDRARELGLESVHHLQGWFNREIAAHLAGRGRKLVGWDEIIEGRPARARGLGGHVLAGRAGRG